MQVKLQRALIWQWLLCGIAVMISGGCNVGPKYSRPETPAVTAESFVNAESQPLDTNDVEALDTWWERFGDPVTAELVKEALANNYNLRAGAARVLQAQSNLAGARGQKYPQFAYDLTRTQTKSYMDFGDALDAFPSDPNNPNQGGGATGFVIDSTTWSQGISVSYLVDFWGKLRHAERAAWADMLAAQASQESLVNSLVASVIESRISIATLQRRLAIIEANIESRQRTLEITERRHRLGLVGPVDVRLARTNLEAAKAQKPNAEALLASAYYALDVLLGRQPGTSASLPESLSDLPNLEPVPVGVPAALLDRRPDIRSLEFSLRAANERVGASIAQLYPDLTLTGSYGGQGLLWPDIWNHEGEAYSIIASISAPIWQGGQLRAQIKMSKARFEELAATYAGTVLQAMSEVENALMNERSLQEQIVHVQAQVTEAQEAERLSRLRYDRGVESLLTVLEAERSRRTAEEQLTILKGLIWSGRVNLHLALGGDWVAPDKQEEQMAKR